MRNGGQVNYDNQAPMNTNNLSAPYGMNPIGGGGGLNIHGGHDNIHDHGLISMAGSTYLRQGMDGGGGYIDSKTDDNWDNDSQESDADDFTECEERGEFVFENRAKYKGQWKVNVRHGYGN